MTDQFKLLLLKKVFPALDKITYPRLVLGQPNHPRRTDRPCAVPRQYAAWSQLNEAYEVVHVLAGECLLKLDDLTFRLRAGDTGVVGRTVRHYEACVKERAPFETVWFFHQGVKRINLYHSRYRSDGTYQLLHNLAFLVPGQLAIDLDRMFDVLAGSDSPRQWQEARKLFVQGMTVLHKTAQRTSFDRAAIAPPRQKWRQEALMTAAVRHIEKHYREKLELEAFARAVSVSPAYLERTFRQFTGATPFEYLTRYRINQALALLKQPELNISQISFRVGYQDPLYFGKVFRQFTGHAPRQYRDKFLTKRQDIFF